MILQKAILLAIKSNSVSWNKFASNLTTAQKKVLSKGLPKCTPIPNVKHVILVSSGKGGVGKSSVTVNLSFALRNLDKNKSVGILDADVFGPSIPQMMNIHNKPELDSNNLIKPLSNFGIKCMSMGFLVDSESALIWRGLMVMQAMQKLLRQVNWGSLDYLLIDMPPGTGDVQLSVVQNIAVSGAIVVSTPQAVALQDAKKSIAMYEKVNCKVLGLVQNMHGYTCCGCGTRNYIFGKDGAANLGQQLQISLLGDIPIDEQIQKCCDEGTPLHLVNPESSSLKAYEQIAIKLIQTLKNPLV